MAEDFDNEPTGAPTPLQPAFAEPQVTDVARAEGYLKQHEANARRYGANYDDVMRQRQDAVKQVQATLNSTIEEMRAKQSGAGPWQVNMPLLSLAAGMLSGTGAGAGNFAAQLGRGLGAMGQTIQHQRMSDADFLKGIAELQAKSGELADVPLKDAATLARMQQIEEQKGANALQKGIVSAKLDRPVSLGQGMAYDPKTGKYINVITGQTMEVGSGASQGPNGSLFGSDVHGQAYLDTIKDPIMRQAIKGIGDYDAQLPNMGRGPATMQIMQQLFAHAKQYNPDFDAHQYNTIAAGQKAWTGSGVPAQQALAAANVQGHLDKLQSSAANLNNTDISIWNKVANGLGTAVGNGRVARFAADRDAVMNELAAFLGKGHPAEGQINAWKQNVANANSPEALQEAIKSFAQIMHTQLTNMANKKTQDLGNKKTFTAEDFLSPENRQSFKDIMTTDISTTGGRYAALRRGENRERASIGQMALPNYDQEKWEKSIEVLKKNPTPEVRQYFDDTFGPGTAAKVLGR